LDLSKVEAGKVEVKTTTVSIADISDFVERSFRKMAEQKKLELHIEIATTAPATLPTDPLRLQQILKNLLSNAFKFTSAGRVTLTIEAASRSAVFQSFNGGDALVAFAVSDTGIGIPEDKHQLIFEPFHQADASTSRNYGGTGLGLAISRELARLLGGEIRLRSTVGEGSTFTLYLPLASHALQLKPKAAERHVETPLVLSHPLMNALSGRRVLVVDDDVRNAFAIRSLLETRGVHVLLADGARSSLDVLQKHPDVDAVLMDIMMPEVDGYEATRNIRAIEAFRELPIIALTSKAMVGDREKILDAGCSDFVPKPVDNDQLLGTLGRWLAKPS
ncbi:MAG TPA: ATP-binding protein, partial [Polyangiaceae bacterium]|nr:ATP-binding protein [Polyangiaceae bacterium]